jgi:SAM-dependent methyltransferase
VWERGIGVTVLDERFDLETLRLARRYQRWILSTFGDALSGDVLEVGPGTGNFTRWIACTARSVLALEPEPVLYKDLQAMDLANVQVLCETIEGLSGTAQRFDTVMLCNVLEHIQDDHGALRISHSLLRPGGHVCVLVPAHPLLFGSLDRRYGHLRRYRRDEVRAALENAGFEGVSARYINPLGAIGWFAVACLAKRPNLSKSSVRLSEWTAVPLGRALDRLGWRLFGQSVVAVGYRDPTV